MRKPKPPKVMRDIEAALTPIAGIETVRVGLKEGDTVIVEVGLDGRARRLAWKHWQATFRYLWGSR